MIRVFFFLSFFSAFSQQIENTDKAIVFRDSLYIFKLNSFLISPLSAPNNFHIRPLFGSNRDIYKGYETLVTKQGLFFLDPLGGEVLKFKNDSLIKMDNSFRHKMQINAAVINHNDTIFKYGGYGFWSMRNYFTFFDPATKEWEIYPPLNTFNFPKGTSAAAFVKKENEAIFFSGKNLNNNDLIDQQDAFDIWNFDFTQKSWSFIGVSDLNFNRFDLSIPFEDKVAYFDDKEIYVVSPFLNKIEVYGQNSVHFKLLKNNHLKSFFHEGVFYCFNNSINTNEIVLLVRNKDEFFGPVIREQKMFPIFSDWWYLSFSLLLFPVFFLIRFFKRRKVKINAITIKDQGVVHKKIFYSLSDHELSILKLLIDKGSVETAKILEIIENPIHNYSHNMRTKNKIMGELQFKLQAILKLQEEIIVVNKSENDKRIMIYTIDLKYFN